MLKRVGERAVVMGASMAGLFAARMLSDRFAEVVVVDRDDLPPDASSRGAVPQGRHFHALLPSGFELAQRWFPGLRADLEAAGVPMLDPVTDVLWYQHGGQRVRVNSDLRMPSVMRPTLEHLVRDRVAALPNVQVRSRTAVEGLEVAGGSVAGARLADGSVVPSELFVDASGRPCRSLPWLATLGVPEPETSVVRVDLRYVSRLFHADGTDPGFLGAFYVGDPEACRGGALFRVDGDRWIMTIGGFNGELAPTEESELLEYLRAFPTPVFADLVERLEPAGEIVTHRYPTDQRRHFERMRDLPGGWAALGDSLCSFDPVYGQGMTSAAFQADALADTLDRVGLGEQFSRRYHKAAGRAVDPAWQLSVAADFTFPGTEGPKPPGTDLVNRYSELAGQAAKTDPTVAVRMWEVLCLVRHPAWLFSPPVVARVLRARRSRPAA